jgi:DNA primase
MEIQDIKSNLRLSQILSHYGLKPKNNMLNCPFHEDKTASLQVNLEKHFYKCHACGAPLPHESFRVVVCVKAKFCMFTMFYKDCIL